MTDKDVMRQAREALVRQGTRRDDASWHASDCDGDDPEYGECEAHCEDACDAIDAINEALKEEKDAQVS